MEFKELRFERAMTCDGGNIFLRNETGRYEVLVTVQGDDSGDYLDHPFEFRTDDLELAHEVYRLIITNADEAADKCRMAFGFSHEQMEREGIWFQLFLVDHELDGIEQDIEDYWLSYDVL